jgi:nitroreductase
MSALNEMNAVETIAFILERRSVRVYAPGEVSDDQVRTLLTAAMAAPSAAGKNPWQFVVVRDRQTMSRLAIALPHGEMLAGAALCVVVCGDLEVAHDNQLSYLLQDCSAATENILLACHVLGLGACWIGVHPRTERIKSVREILLLPNPIIPIACISIGRPGETKEPRASYRADAVHFETW